MKLTLVSVARPLNDASASFDAVNPSAAEHQDVILAARGGGGQLMTRCIATLVNTVAFGLGGESHQPLRN